MLRHKKIMRGGQGGCETIICCREILAGFPVEFYGKLCAGLDETTRCKRSFLNGMWLPIVCQLRFTDRSGQRT